MVRDGDPVIRKAEIRQIFYVNPIPSRRLEGQIQHLIEVAVIEPSLPIDADEGSAHDLFDVLGPKGIFQGLEIRVELPGGTQGAAKTLNRHVRERVKIVEDDAITLAQFPFVVVLQLLLRGRQKRASRVVNQIQYQIRALSLSSIPQIVELAQGADARVEDPLAPLSIDILLEITGKGGDDLHLLGGEKFGQSILGRLVENREIATVDDPQLAATGLGDQATEIAIDLRRATGKVEGGYRAFLQKIEYRVDCLRRHFFRAVGTGPDMTMSAGLIAAIAEVELQYL